MAEVKAPERIWAVDLDETGSMHACSKGDPGCVEYRRSDLHDDLVKAADALVDICRALDSAITATSGLAPKAAVDRMLWAAADRAGPALSAYRKARGDAE